MKQRIVRVLIIVSLCMSNLHAKSIQELIDSEPRRVRVRNGILNLDGLGIDSLEGLNNVPKIDTVRLLKLNNNNIQSIKAGELAAAVNVRGLALTNNGLEDIEANAFAGLSNLWVLNLNSNNISLVPQDSLNGMTNIKILAIGDNPITASEINSLYKQIPSVWKIMSVPITKANLKKLGIGAAAIAGVALAVAGAAVGIKKAAEKARGSEEEQAIKGIEQKVHEALQGSAFENNLNELESLLAEAKQQCEEVGMKQETEKNLMNRLRWATRFMETTQGNEAARERAGSLISEANDLLKKCLTEEVLAEEEKKVRKRGKGVAEEAATIGRDVLMEQEAARAKTEAETKLNELNTELAGLIQAAKGECESNQQIEQATRLGITVTLRSMNSQLPLVENEKIVQEAERLMRKAEGVVASNCFEEKFNKNIEQFRAAISNAKVEVRSKESLSQEDKDSLRRAQQEFEWQEALAPEGYSISNEQQRKISFAKKTSKALLEGRECPAQ